MEIVCSGCSARLSVKAERLEGALECPRCGTPIASHAAHAKRAGLHARDEQQTLQLEPDALARLRTLAAIDASEPVSLEPAPPAESEATGARDGQSSSESPPLPREPALTPGDTPRAPSDEPPGPSDRAPGATAAKRGQAERSAWIAWGVVLLLLIGVGVTLAFFDPELLPAIWDW